MSNYLKNHYVIISSKNIKAEQLKNIENKIKNNNNLIDLNILTTKEHPNAYISNKELFGKIKIKYNSFNNIDRILRKL